MRRWSASLPSPRRPARRRARLGRPLRTRPARRAGDRAGRRLRRARRRSRRPSPTIRRRWSGWRASSSRPASTSTRRPTTAASSSGGAAAEHTIQFPPAVYGVWRPERARWALGLGLDAPTWRLMDWENALFPARFTARRSEADALRAPSGGGLGDHERWSVGGGLRYVRGTVGYGDTMRAFEPGAGGPVGFEVDRVSEATADGVGFDVATQFRRRAMGLRSHLGERRRGLGRGRHLVPRPRLRGAARPTSRRGSSARYGTQPSRLSEDLPDTLTAGAWFAVSPSVRRRARRRLRALVGGRARERAAGRAGFALDRRSGWDDTLAFRLGVEWALGDSGWQPRRRPRGRALAGRRRRRRTGRAARRRPGLRARGVVRRDAAASSFDLGYSLPRLRHEPRRHRTGGRRAHGRLELRGLAPRSSPSPPAGASPPGS